MPTTRMCLQKWSVGNSGAYLALPKLTGVPSLYRSVADGIGTAQAMLTSSGRQRRERRSS